MGRGKPLPTFMPKVFSTDGDKVTIAHEVDGNLVLATTQDVTEIIEANKRQVNEATRKVDQVMTHIARIPNTVIDDLNQKGIMRGFVVSDQKRFKAWLNNPDNRVWRTYPGSV